MGAFKELAIDHEDRDRKLKSILFIVRAIPNFKTRVMPWIDGQQATVFWPALELEFRTPCEAIALQWMRAIWFETAPFHSGAQFRLSDVDTKIKEAIIMAIADDAFAGYLIDDYFAEESRTAQPE
jgi:hypothetical protein